MALSKTLDQYLSHVRSLLQEIDPATSHWGQELLKDMWNSAYFLRAADLVMAFEGYFIQRATTPVTANVSFYEWPNDYERLIKLELVRSDGRTVPLRRFERHEEVNIPPVSAGDTYFPHFRPTGLGFYLEPMPMTTEGSLQLEYNVSLARMTNDTDRLHEEFPVTFEELLVLDTVVYAIDSESVLEGGAVRSILRQREEWMVKWERFIDNRIVARQNVSPFIASYDDA